MQISRQRTYYMFKDLYKRQTLQNASNACTMYFATNASTNNNLHPLFQRTQLNSRFFKSGILENPQCIMTPMLTCQYTNKVTHSVEDTNKINNLKQLSTIARLKKAVKEYRSTSSEKLKKAVKEYGSTVIVFHISISLMSLGICYTLVSSGVDLAAIIQKIGLMEDKINKLGGSAGTFVIAYAVHKVLAPARIGITLTATPFIVKYLRKRGWLKK